MGRVWVWDSIKIYPTSRCKKAGTPIRNTALNCYQVKPYIFSIQMNNVPVDPSAT